MYKAIKEVGGYRIGDEVPEALAEVWLQMYVEPHVEKVVETKIENKEAQVKEESLSNSILEDYLARNQSVVRKNVDTDDLSKNQLNELLKMEENDKRRPLIIQAIKKRLNR